MTLVYFDSSALVKLLVEEEGSDLAAALWDGCDGALSSRHSYPEVRAALVTATRVGRLTSADQHRAETAWDAYWASTLPVELTEGVSRHAGHLASEHFLRGADAVHLASMLVLGDETIFAVWDKRLRVAALAEGVRLAPAQPASAGQGARDTP